jgi:hypothetical protein
VGYSNIFPSTQVGRLVASVLFILGPSLAAKALDHDPEEAPSVEPALPPGHKALLSKLDEILQELKKRSGPAA